MSSPALPGTYGLPPRGSRLPDKTRLGPVHLRIADLARSVGFYESVLGMRVLDRADGSASLGAHGDDRVLLRLQEQRGAAAWPRQGRLGLYHFALLLPDRGALGRFVSHLAARDIYAGASDHLVSEALYLRDPDDLGTNTWAGIGALPTRDDEAGLLEWTIELPDAQSIEAAAASLSAAGYGITRSSVDVVTTNPWGTAVRLQMRS